MVWRGGPWFVVRGARVSALIGIAASLSTSCGGRSSLLAFDSGDDDGGTANAGGSAGGGGGGVWTSGSGGSTTGGTGGTLLAGSGGVVIGGTGGVAGLGGTGGVAGLGGTGGSGGTITPTVVCGDGLLSSIEECDDGNVISGDGCSSMCRVEPGGTCAESGQPCTFSVCGNGVVESGEECDAGAANDLFYGDRTGCSKYCLLEPDCRFGVCARRCGDGNVGPGEACDDGNRFDGDGCGAGCDIEPGFECELATLPSAEPCADGEAVCQRVGITYRDFEPWEGVGSGHLDFYLLGATRDGQKRTCVPDASGRSVSANGDCYANDSTSLCRGFVTPKLGLSGRPVLEAAPSCDCRFTDFSDSGLLADHPAVQICQDADGASHEWVEETITLVAGPDTFADWFATSDPRKAARSSLELREDGAGFRFSSGPTVEEELHDIFMGRATALSGGFFPLESFSSRRVCNLFPYFLPGLSADCSAGPGKLLPHQWDPRGSDTPGVEGTGGIVAPVQGVARNFHFTSEAHVLYRYTGSGTITFAGDDDAWVFLNGQLVLDLGGTHTRLRGTVTLSGPTASWVIEAQDPATLAFQSVLSSTTPADIGLVEGNVYDLAVFHANRSPRDSNYELRIDRNDREISVCYPRCGDGVVTIGEECDLGEGNTAEGYGGCTTDCHVGSYCGDGIVDAKFGEECDAGEPSDNSESNCSQCVLQVR